jgi:hypothetical protein
MARQAFRRPCVNSQRLAAIVTIVVLSFSTAAFAGEKQKRPASLRALYVALGAAQTWDIYSTSTALHAGAKESNPAAAPFAGDAGSMIGLKAATTASTIFFAERLWKTNRVGAVVLMVGINAASAAVSIRNMHNARFARGSVRR